MKMEIMETDPKLHGLPNSYDESLNQQFPNNSGNYEYEYEVKESQDETENGRPRFESVTSIDRVEVCDSTSLLQAVVFVEDAVRYRSINHKTTSVSLWYYRLYYSTVVQIIRYLAILTILIVAFFEYPSSITTGNSSDPRYRGERLDPPCGVTEGIEVVCIVIFVMDLVMKVYLKGVKQCLRSPWVIAYFFVLIATGIDWSITIKGACGKVFRARRMLRPFFLLQNSSLMKKTIRSIMRTLPKVISVIMLLLIHLYFFTMVGMLIFPQRHHNVPNAGISTETSIINATTKPPSTESNKADMYREADVFFSDLLTGFMSMLVLLTTANNPDVMMPAYMLNRFYCLYFIAFLVIGLYFFFNMLTAVIYNEFRGYLLHSMQTSLVRRRLGFQAAFEMLRRQGRLTINTAGCCSTNITLSVSVVKAVVLQANIKKSAKKAIVAELDDEMGGSLTSTDFHQLFDALDRITDKRKPPIVMKANSILRKIQFCITHSFFNYFGALVAVCNVVIISVEVQFQYDNSFYSRNNVLAVVNFCFIMFYLVEMILKIWAYGFKRYISSKLNVFDGILTLVLLGAEIFYGVVNGSFFAPVQNPSSMSESISLYDLVRAINILIIFRLFRLVTHFKTMSVIAATLFGLIRNLGAFFGILVVIYYVFAMLGMELFSDVIPFPQEGKSDYRCGTYRQLEYWANNFDDFAASLVVLFDIMVVNNWHVFLSEYEEVTNKWSYMFFVSWYFVSVLVCLNVFTALILENFITKWDREQQEPQSHDRELRPSYQMSVHNMFRDDLKEPTEEELLESLRKHPHMKHMGL